MENHGYSYYFFDQGNTPGGSKLTKENYEICLVVNLLWPIVINKTIIQQNRIKTLHHNGNPNYYYYYSGGR